MNTQIRQYIECLKRANELEESLKEIYKDHTLNTPKPLRLKYTGKLVIEDKDEGMIYRIEDTTHNALRTELVKEARSWGIKGFFLDEEIVERNDSFTVSKQPKLKEFHFQTIPISFFNEEEEKKLVFDDNSNGQLVFRVKTDYPDQYELIKEFLNLYEVRGITRENCGIDKDGKIRVFDWFGNYWVNNKYELYKRERENG